MLYLFSMQESINPNIPQHPFKIPLDVAKFSVPNAVHNNLRRMAARPTLEVLVSLSIGGELRGIRGVGEKRAGEIEDKIIHYIEELPDDQKGRANLLIEQYREFWKMKVLDRATIRFLVYHHITTADELFELKDNEQLRQALERRYRELNRSKSPLDILGVIQALEHAK